jgi:hypothetical protein
LAAGTVVHYLEARSSLSAIQIGRGRPRKFIEALEALKIVVCHVLRGTGGTRSCDLHRALFDLVKPRAVLSFNYDLIADQTMLELGILNWTIKQYRGARRIEVPTDRGSKYLVVNTRKLHGQRSLLKLHGSMNWEEQGRGTGYRLSGCKPPSTLGEPLTYVRVPDKPYIVPPVAAKMQIEKPELREHWQDAVSHLKEAPSWVIWGYSFPTTDTISQVLFRAALARHKKAKPVLVINPDMSVAARVKTVCDKVDVEQSASMERFLLDNKELEFPPV